MNINTIPLTRGLIATIDPEDYEYLSLFKWQARPTKNGIMYASGRVNGKQVSMHRLIMGMPRGLDVHHINNNTIDNRRANLAIVTRANNLRARRMFSNNTSGYRGVSFVNNKYYATLRVQCDTAERAARLWDKLAVTAYGEEWTQKNFL